MPRTVVIDPTDPAPIWRQIEEGVRRLAASGALAPASPVPSVRELAAELRVNPATVAKAYQRLTDAGVLAVRRGEGTYVAEAPPRIPESERRRTLRAGASRYAALAASIGADRERAVEELGAVWRTFERTAGKGRER
ncbi:MAG TPA: GntR family transcriptional regulator [Thermoanaerobaculaceae bacterium]|nr:GntR family transcriptional regulator [Thermoanaerobaculaceae bacterium]